MYSADQCSTQLPEGLSIVSGKMSPDDREEREASKGAASEPVLLGSAALCFCSHQVFSYMHQGRPVNWAFPVTAMLCSDEVMGVAFLDSASWSTSIMVNMVKTKMGAQG